MENNAYIILAIAGIVALAATGAAIAIPALLTVALVCVMVYSNRDALLTAFRKNQSANLGAAGIVAVLGVLMVIVVGLALVPTIQNSTNDSTDALGANTAAGNLAELVPLFFVLIIIAIIVAAVVVAFRAN